MGVYKTESHTLSDPAVRLVRESDIPAVTNLFKLNYGNDYPFPEVYDGGWVKRIVYTDGIICVVLEEGGEVIGIGALNLDYGDYNDQIGELARLVVHPLYTGRGAGRRVIAALFEAAQDHVEFAIGEARTAHAYSQKMVERAGFTVVGFIPHYYKLHERGESLVTYAKLHGNGQDLRSNNPPQIIPEVVPLARHVLSTMGLPGRLAVVEGCEPYPVNGLYTTQPMDRLALSMLARIKHGRLVEPLLFGGISLDQGYSLIRRRNAVYLMAVDENNKPMGAVGFQEDRMSHIVKGVEMIGKEHDLRGLLCGSLLRAAGELGADVIEVNVSAYDPRLQQTFYDLGFRPVAYGPAMVFHKIERLDVVKMHKLNVPYEPDEMELTESAKAVVSIVKDGFL